MKYFINTLALALGMWPVLYGQVCTISADDNDLTEEEIKSCLNANGCPPGTDGCTVIVSANVKLLEAVDLTAYSNLTFIIRQGPRGTGGSLTFDNNGSSKRSGVLLLSGSSKLVVEDVADTNGNGGGDDNTAALEGGIVSNTGGSPPILISIGATGYTESQFDDIIASGGVTGAGALPIELSEFGAVLRGSQVDLHWRTATERNNDYMEVQHSTDGRQYRKIGKVLGAGTTQEEQAYTFRHETPTAGLNYYRLLQVDYDGAYEYHGPVSVRMKGDKGGQLSLFPTVASETVEVQYEGPLSSEAEWQVIDLNGRVWQQRRWEAKSASFSLPVQGLPVGMYLLRLQRGREVETARFVKQ